MNIKKTLNRMYALLEAHFGDLGWWPAETDFEVVTGAILTQNTSWKNVEKAIERLKQKDMIDPVAVKNVKLEELSQLIKPSGYHRVKARRLKTIAQFIIENFEGSIKNMKSMKSERLRKMLLSVNGVGPETADSILLYAVGKPVFVVDAYTKRIFARHGITDDEASYEDVQSVVHSCVPKQARTYNQFHALLVETAKNFCGKRKPLCEKCPLCIILPKCRGKN